MAERRPSPLSAALRLWRAFGRNADGATAVEFAILAVPFFAILGAMMETAMVLLASQVLDSAVQDSARLISTGQAQLAGVGTAQYKAEVCDRLHGLFDCGALKLKVSVVSDFASAVAPPPIDPATGQWQLVESFNPGMGRQIVMVQAYYKWPTMVDIGGFAMGNTPDGNRLLGAVRVFANEPF